MWFDLAQVIALLDQLNFIAVLEVWQFHQVSKIKNLCFNFQKTENYSNKLNKRKYLPLPLKQVSQWWLPNQGYDKKKLKDINKN